MIPGLQCDEAINDRKVWGSFSPLKRQGQFSVFLEPPAWLDVRLLKDLAEEEGWFYQIVGPNILWYVFCCPAWSGCTFPLPPCTSPTPPGSVLYCLDQGHLALTSGHHKAGRRNGLSPFSWFS